MPDEACKPVIRRAEENDIDKLYAIELKSFDNPYPEVYLRILFNLTPYFFVASCNGTVAGYIIAVPQEHSICHILSIAVDPSYRRKGIGTTLLSRALEECENSGYKIALLEVEYTNFPAQRLYVSQGFRYVTGLPNYYGSHRHALIMARYTGPKQRALRM